MFSANNKLAGYPLLLLYLPSTGFRPEAPVQTAFSVPRRKIKKAVKRNRIKRLMREAWRLNKHVLYEALQEQEKSYDFVFIYIGQEENPAFRQMEKAVKKLSKKFLQKEKF